LKASELKKQVLRAHEALLPERGSAAGLRERITARLLRGAVRALAAARGLDPMRARLRLFAAHADDARASAFDWGELDTEIIGAIYEASTELEARQSADGRLELVLASGRKRSGVFFTPAELTRTVVASALTLLESRSMPSVCDPAVGGGAFLVEVCRQLAERGLDKHEVASRCLTAMDRSELAIAVAEACVWLEVADPAWDAGVLRERLLVGDSLFARFPGDGFDLVIGNPPWVAYAGRAAQPLEPEQRADYAQRFTAFRGYPTLHGMFVERAAALAPRGVVALLVPSPIADLAGYLPVRRALARTHTVREPLLELGQDAFDGVTQPCFVLIAEPGADLRGDREWRLSERQRLAGQAAEVAPPAVLERVAALPTLPRELFGEMGFQSSGDVAKTLLSRTGEPDARHHYPLLEGKDVREFWQGPPRLYLDPDPEALARARCRLRDRSAYQRVAFVVRQTAALPIAALHSGLPFRNSLLAGFPHDELPPATVVALLNSSLYRALHVSRRRDARQAAFPQVKVAHLRALPRPPADAAVLSALSELTRRATEHGMTAELRIELDRAVFDLFGCSEPERAAVAAFLSAG
jgi:methylase of polypeptide subunit release factors